MNNKLSIYFMFILLLIINILYSGTARAETKMIYNTINDTIVQVENLINHSKIVEENLISVDDKSKQRLILELDKELKKKNRKYNVEISERYNVSDYTILGRTLPDGEIQYSLSVNSISLNDKGIVNNVELLNFIFTEEYKLINVYELKGILDEDNNVHSKLWVDTKLIGTLNTNIETIIKNENADAIGDEIAEKQKIEKNKSLIKKNFSVSGLADRWKCTQSCVASKGVNLLVFGAMLAVCGLVCNPAALAASAGLAGGACYACANSAGILGVNTVINCWNTCPY
ncbi:hypothetical protein [Lysinibacillus sp. FSL K6-3209]|uniref:hypothetical protein n=1 Tax=Lysinibacillus sp. FSL K6-3209 TaxID=2921497 RepID=UPI0030DACAE0